MSLCGLPIAKDSAPVGSLVYHRWDNSHEECTELLVLSYDTPGATRTVWLWVLDSHGWSVDRVGHWNISSFHHHTRS